MPIENLETYFSKKSAKEFTVDDLFNGGNKLHGWICQAATSKYGAMYIDKVNGKPTEQFILATPKMHYPHNKDGIFSWKHGIVGFDVYTKIDGSNIFQYGYKDAEGNQFYTYKTRRRPVLEPGGAFSIYELWNEVLDIHPDIPEYPHKNGMNISYEMYGRKNLIMLRYPELIDTKIIFGRDDLGRIWSPKELTCGLVGHAELITEIKKFSDMREEYEKIKFYLEDKIKVTEREGDSDLVEGLEGAILYGVTDTGCVQYKAKPSYVMDIHIKQSMGIPVHSIMTTVRNAFEETDNVTFDLIVELLKEEFTDEMIYRKTGVIKRTVDDMNLYMRLRKLIVEEYDKLYKEDNSFDINLDKSKVMRHFAGRMKDWQLDKRSSSKVFKIIVDNYGVEA
jgi:hypothetical protein